MLRDQYPYYLANKPVQANTDLVVNNKYTGEPACRVSLADTSTIDTAIGAAVDAFEHTRKMPAHRRQAVLSHVVHRVAKRHEELAQVLCIEAGKPIRDARGEVTRLIDTFRVASEESVRIGGEHMPLDAQGRAGDRRRLPVHPQAGKLDADRCPSPGRDPGRD
jgi:acyl-CoA reductase-like NAD-dependent aldehyde dehydrogenase